MQRFWKTAKAHTRLLIAAGVVAVTLAANGLIAFHLSHMEKDRERQHFQLTEKIAEASESFLANREHHYFYDILRLMHEMYYVKCLVLYVGDEAVSKIGTLTPEEDQGLLRRPRGHRKMAWEGPGNIFWVSVPLEYQPGSWASILAAYSLEETRRAKRMIGVSLGISLALLIFLVLLLMKLQATEKMKAAMLSAISHDAMHNLQPIFNQIAQFLDQDRGNYSRLGILGVMRNIKTNLLAVQRVLENLRFNDQLGRGKIKVVRCPTDMDERVRFVMENYARQALDKGIALSYRPAGDACWVEGDPILLGSVLMNLLDNAMKYSPPKTAIRLEMARTESQVQLEVIDQGVGIPNDAWEDVFKPYVRRVDAANHEKGSGLGLSNARRLVALHGGDLGITESQEGAGTTFRLRLPRGGAGKP